MEAVTGLFIAVSVRRSLVESGSRHSEGVSPRMSSIDNHDKEKTVDC